MNCSHDYHLFSVLIPLTLTPHNIQKDGLAQGILVASVCQGVVRAPVLSAHACPLLLRHPRARPPPAPHLGHRQHRQLGVRVPGRHPRGARLGDHWQLQLRPQENQSQLRNFWRIQRYEKN